MFLPGAGAGCLRSWGEEIQCQLSFEIPSLFLDLSATVIFATEL